MNPHPASRIPPPDSIPPRPIRQTHTYATLEVNPETYDDVRARLEKAGMLSDYVQVSPSEELIVLGPIALLRRAK